VATYGIDASTGALIPAAGSPLVSLSNAAGLQIDPSGKFAYTVADAGAGQTAVYGYSIDASTGALTSIVGSPFATSGFPGNPTGVSVSN
jgi:6-phosphogluconolactonase